MKLTLLALASVFMLSTAVEARSHAKRRAPVAPSQPTEETYGPNGELICPRGTHNVWGWCMTYLINN